jgi:hypothetical protein
MTSIKYKLRGGTIQNFIDIVRIIGSGTSPEEIMQIRQNIANYYDSLGYYESILLKYKFGNASETLPVFSDNYDDEIRNYTLMYSNAIVNMDNRLGTRTQLDIIKSQLNSERDAIISEINRIKKLKEIEEDDRLLALRLSKPSSSSSSSSSSSASASASSMSAREREARELREAIQASERKAREARERDVRSASASASSMSAREREERELREAIQASERKAREARSASASASTASAASASSSSSTEYYRILDGRRIYNQTQSEDLSCGRCIINNLIGKEKFLKNRGREITDIRQYIDVRDDEQINLLSLCELLHSVYPDYITSCSEKENYEIYLLIVVLYMCGFYSYYQTYDFYDFIYRLGTDDFNYCIIGTGTHWTCAKYQDGKYYYFDSIIAEERLPSVVMTNKERFLEYLQRPTFRGKSFFLLKYNNKNNIESLDLPELIEQVISDEHRNKYLKYKNKYLSLKSQMK